MIRGLNLSAVRAPVSAREYRAAFAVAMVGTALPLAITASILSGPAVERNPVVGALAGVLGWTGLAVLSLGVTAVIILFYRALDARGYHGCSRAGLWMVAGLSAANSMNDLAVWMILNT